MSFDSFSYFLVLFEYQKSNTLCDVCFVKCKVPAKLVFLTRKRHFVSHRLQSEGINCDEEHYLLCFWVGDV